MHPDLLGIVLRVNELEKAVSGVYWTAASHTSLYLREKGRTIGHVWQAQRSPEVWNAITNLFDYKPSLRFNTLREAKTWCEVTYKLESS